MEAGQYEKGYLLRRANLGKDPLTVTAVRVMDVNLSEIAFPIRPKSCYVFTFHEVSSHGHIFQDMFYRTLSLKNVPQSTEFGR